jgi:amino acid adenylation domain-containing protein
MSKYPQFSPEKQQLLAYLLAEENIELAHIDAIIPRNNPQTSPLSFAQERLWFLEQLNPQNPAYNIPVALRIEGQLEITVLEQCLNEIIQRHDTLRSKFVAEAGQSVEIAVPQVELPIQRVNLGNVAPDRHESSILELAIEESQTPFDLTQDSLIRAKILSLSATEQILLLTMHHAIADGWSLGILVQELAALYEAFVTGKPSQLSPLPIQYGDFAAWQRQRLQGELLETQLEYWKQNLSGSLPVIDLPTDRTRPAIQTFKGAKRSLKLSQPLLKEIESLSQQQGVTLFMTLLTAFKVLLYRYTGQEDILVGSPVAGRDRIETENLIGLFVNTLVLRTNLSGNPTFLNLLDRVREVVVAAYNHQEVPLEKLVETLQPERDLSYSPLFQVMFALQNTPTPSLEFADLTLTPIPVDNGTSKFDLTLDLSQTPDGIDGFIEYNTDIFDDDTIARMVGHLQTLLEGIVAHPDRQLSKLPLLTPTEKQQILVEWNDTQADYALDSCLHHLIEAQVARTPDAVAVVFAEQQLTYRQLNQRANQLARYLQKLGVKPEVRVGICVERSLEMVVGLLAILKAGGAYVPFDPDYPTARLEFMLEDAAVPVLLTQNYLRDRLPSHQAQVVNLDTNWTIIGQESPHNLESATTPDNAAYIIYTSGSTGQPKGVINTHQGICNRLLWMQERYQLTASDRVLQKTPFSFDVSVWEFFWTLITGATLVVAKPGGHRDSGYLVKLIAQEQITTVHFVPSMLRIFLAEEDLTTCSCLRQVMCSGEALAIELQESFFTRMSSTKLHNLYGPTEAAVDVTFWECLPQDCRRSVPIGRPIANTQIYILDSNLQPVPVGVSGELHIGGVNLARGYYNRLDLTTAKFIPNPFNKSKSDKLYKTGDLARYLPDGNIEYMGRLDNQVKIRGFRIELGEIETVLSQHPQVREAVVTVSEDRSLVGYVVVPEQDRPTTTELTSFLAGKLPEYMVPATLVFLESLPLTPNGKIDRGSLIPPQLELEHSFVAPRNQVETAIAKIWSEVLKLESIGIYHNFFELGGHSLLATQVVSRLRKTFDVELPLRSLFEAPTVANLAETITNLSQTLQKSQALPILPATRDGYSPLSFAQARLWFLEQLQSGSSAYHLSAAIKLKGCLNPEGLERSLQQIVNRHEVLRTNFIIQNGHVMQAIRATAPTSTLTIPAIDLERVLDPEAAIETWLAQEAQQPFNLERDLLLRATLLRLSAVEHVLLLTMHHIVSDGWSINIFVRELADLYSAETTGTSSQLTELPIQYADFACWQHQWLQGDVLQTQLSYWKKKLEGDLPVLDLPTDYPRSNIPNFQGKHQKLILSNELSHLLKQLSQQEGATLFMTLLAALKTLLYRYTQQEDILIGSPIAGRNHGETEPLIGFFVNTLVLRTDLSGQPTFREVLQRVKETALGAYAHQDLPFEKLLEEVQPQRDLSHNPLFKVFFNSLNFADEAIALPGLTTEILSLPEVGSKFDVTLYVKEQQEGIHLEIVYNADLFEAVRIAQMLEQMQYLLSQIAIDVDQKIDDLSLLTPEIALLLPNPTQHLLSTWEGAIHHQFAVQAKRVPQNVAIVDRDESWNYQELDLLSNQLANYLLATGIKSQEVVAIYGHRSAALVWAILGILKAGAAFTILDPSYPTSRLIECIQVAQPRFWLQLPTTGEIPELLATSCRDRLQLTQGDLQSLQILLSDYGTEEPKQSINPDDLAYVAFTSGSTGIPKGILGTHRPIPHFLTWQRRTFELRSSDRFSMLSGISHDPLLRDILAPLSLGATLCIPDPDRLLTPKYLAQWMHQEQISIAHLTPAMTQLLGDAGAGSLSLRYVFFGGDILTKHHVAQIQELAPLGTCVNFYGSTETPQAMGYFVCDCDRTKETIPIGTGIEDVQLLIFNNSQQLASVGEIGQIYVRTPYLSKGYIGDDPLTQNRFITNPYTQNHSDRLYQTGDLGRYLPNGNIEILGRSDRQVKIRGFRIELGEIERVLDRYPIVRQSLVMIREDRDNSKCLVAYLVLNYESDLAIAQLRSFLQEQLPEYMVPSFFVVLNELPLTPNGKIDRHQLPAPNWTRPDWEQVFVAPRTPIEEMLARIWAEVLGIEQIGIHDNFFTLGGHSLLATKLMFQVSQTFQVDLPLRCLFETPTVAGLSVAIAQHQQTRGTDTVSVLPQIEPALEQRHLPFPLTDVQQAYWIGRSGAIELGNVASHRYIEFESTEFNLERFNLAWQCAIERHDMLRAVISPDGQQQILEQVPPYQIKILDLRGQEPQAIAPQLETVRQMMSHQVMNPEQWPLFEVRASILRDNHIRLHFSFDYLTSDAWSFQILMLELFQIYQNLDVVLTPLDLSFRDYVLTQIALQDSELYRRSQDYWRKRLPSLPPAPELPLVQNPGSLTHPRFVGQSAKLEPEIWSRLKTRANQAGLTPSGVLLAAFAEILRFWSKKPRFTIVLTIFNRLPLHPQVNDIIGDFTSTNLLAVESSPDISFEGRARSIQKQLWEDLEHGYVSGVQVLRELAQFQGGATRAVMPVVFTSTLSLGTLDIDTSLIARALSGDVVYSISQTPQVFLDHQVSEQGGALILNWDAVAELFPDGLLQEMFSAYCTFLQRLADEEETWQQKTLQLLPPGQLEQRESINATQAPISEEMLHTLFAAQVAQRSQQVAVVSSNRTLTYHQLSCRANQVARKLRQMGACPNTLIAVVMEKGWEQVVAVLGVLQSGAAYLPIDPGLPQERLQHLLEQGEVKLVLTQSWLDPNLTWAESIQRLKVDDEDLQGIDDSPLESVQQPEDLAYVIFTSGSTGLPKGVMIDHRGAVNTIIDINRRFHIEPQDRVLALSSLNFDLSVYDFFGTLAAGGTIIIPDPQATPDPSHWIELIVQHQISIWNSVPAMMQMLVEYATSRSQVFPPSLRLVLLSGDWLPLRLPNQIKALFEGVEVISLGGATEASIWSILYPIETVDPIWNSIPYGRPMVNQTFYVFNEALEPSPVWVSGQLYIGGIGLAQGYWRNEEKTSASFITHPLTGERLYHTGDLGRYLPDGNIEFLGREDFQVKIHGYRIELGEIEAVLTKHPAVRTALVTTLGELDGQKRLVAYLVADQEMAPPVSELKRFLREKLPDYMVPSTFLRLDALPLTANGKVDRKALPTLAPVIIEPETTFIAPRNPIEAALVDIYTQVLSVESVSIYDDFFSLGGNSVGAILLLSRVRETFCVELPLHSIFENPTIAGLAEVLTENQVYREDSNELSRILAEIEELSDDEIQKMLAEEMQLNNQEYVYNYE